MKKELTELNWKPMWTAHMGCIKGCLDFLGVKVSDAWLFGGTGHAFVINMHEVVCPSGPTAWNTCRMFELGRNLGYEVCGVFGFKTDEGFSQKQEKAWDLVKKSIDEGIPCYGWELGIPEYYVVKGYDDVGYLYSGVCLDNPGVKMPLPWKELGTTDIGVLEMYSVRPCKPADDATVVKDALSFALQFAKSPEAWVFPKYRAGLEGFDLWIKALEEGKAHLHGMAYNTEVWRECRHRGADFLREAGKRLGGKLAPLCDEAAGHYDRVAKSLDRLAGTFPFPMEEGQKLMDTKDPALRDAGLRHLREARKAEEAGLASLARIVEALS